MLETLACLKREAVIERAKNQMLDSQKYFSEPITVCWGFVSFPGNRNDSFPKWDPIDQHFWQELATVLARIMTFTSTYNPLWSPKEEIVKNGFLSNQ